GEENRRQSDNLRTYPPGRKSRVFRKRVQRRFLAEYCEIRGNDYRSLLWLLQKQRRIVRGFGRRALCVPAWLFSKSAEGICRSPPRAAAGGYGRHFRRLHV